MAKDPPSVVLGPARYPTPAEALVCEILEACEGWPDEVAAILVACALSQVLDRLGDDIVRRACVMQIWVPGG